MSLALISIKDNLKFPDFNFLTMAKIQLTRGYYSIIDIEDYEKVISASSTWNVWLSEGQAYARYRKGNNISVYLHRTIINAPKGLYVDHIDHNGLNNTKANLRIASNSQNQMNKQKPRSNNTSGTTGVVWHAGSGKYMAKITVDQKTIYLGIYQTLEEAISVRKAAEKKYFGEFVFHET